MTAVRFGTDLRVGDPLDGHVIVKAHRGIRGEILVTLDNGQQRSFAWNQQVAPTTADQCGFVVVDSSGKIECKTCGQQFPRREGSVMRSHAKRHGVVVAVPARCDA